MFTLVDYVYGVRDVTWASSLTPNTQSTPPHSGPPTYYNIRKVHHTAPEDGQKIARNMLSWFKYQ